MSNLAKIKCNSYLVKTVNKLLFIIINIIFLAEYFHNTARVTVKNCEFLLNVMYVKSRLTLLVKLGALVQMSCLKFLLGSYLDERRCKNSRPPAAGWLVGFEAK